jgi:hypothetical protein
MLICYLDILYQAYETFCSIPSISAKSPHASDKFFMSKTAFYILCEALGLASWKIAIPEIGDGHGFLRNWRFVPRLCENY